MRVLNIEDNALKHYEIGRVLKACADPKIDWARNLEDALSMARSCRYDLYITDMWYPERAGGPDARSGEKFIAEVLKGGDRVPCILCSNQNYAYPEIYGTLYFSDRSDWEMDLERLVRQLQA